MTDVGAVNTTNTRDPQLGRVDPTQGNAAEVTPNPSTPAAQTRTNADGDTFQRTGDDRPRAPDADPAPRPILIADNRVRAGSTPGALGANSGRDRLASTGGSALPSRDPMSGGPPLKPTEAISASRGTFELASRELEAGRGDKAAELLRGGATELRRSIPGADPTQSKALTALADNMDARAAAYGETVPKALREKAGRLADASWEARKLGQDLAHTNPALSKQLTDVGMESRLQAEVLFNAAGNSDALLGRGVGQTYKAIADASFDRAIHDTGTLNNLITGRKDQLTKDKAKVDQVFQYLDQKMSREGISFDRAWNGMFDDHRISSPDRPPGFPTAHEAAVFLRDHEVTRGLLSPMADISRNLSEGNMAGVDRGKGDLVQALRTNGQWDIARGVLDDLQKNSKSGEGRERAQALNDSERREWWTQKAGDFVQKDLPVLMLSTALSGGAGLGARALATAAGWGTRAIQGAQIAAEIGSFVPTERVLNDVMNGRRADWSAGGLARDYALTAGGYGLFHALGAGWRALRAPAAVGPEAAGELALGGRPTRINPGDAPENIRALTSENNSAQSLARNGYRVEQNPAIPGGNVPGVKHPDYRIGGEYFDNFAPTTGSARNIWSTVEGKVTSDQARRIVLNLDHSTVSMDALRKQFADWPIQNLEQVLVVKNGQVFSLGLPKPPANIPWVRPKGYPHQDN